MASQTRVPISEYSKTGTWTPSTGSTVYEVIDDDPPLSSGADTDYVTHGTTGGNWDGRISAFTVPAGSVITNVKMYCRAQKTGADAVNFQMRIRLGTAEGGSVGSHSGSLSVAEGTFGDFVWTMTTNPQTGGAWTVDQVNAVGSTAYAIRCIGAYGFDANPTILLSQLYVEVNYTPSPEVSVSDSVTVGETGTAVEVQAEGEGETLLVDVAETVTLSESKALLFDPLLVSKIQTVTIADVATLLVGEAVPLTVGSYGPAIIPASVTATTIPDAYNILTQWRYGDTPNSRTLLMTSDAVLHMVCTFDTDPDHLGGLETRHYWSSDYTTWDYEVLSIGGAGGLYQSATNGTNIAVIAESDVAQVAEWDGADWGTAYNLDTDGLTISTQQWYRVPAVTIAYDPSGTLWVAYVTSDPDSIYDIGIAVRSKPVGGSWSAPTIWYDPSGERDDLFLPTLAIGADGTVHLTFAKSLNEQEYGLYYTACTGGSWSGPLLLNYFTGSWAADMAHTGASILPLDGEVVFAWRGSDPSDVEMELFVGSLIDGDLTVQRFPAIGDGPQLSAYLGIFGERPFLVFDGVDSGGEGTYAEFVSLRVNGVWSLPAQLATGYNDVADVQYPSVVAISSTRLITASQLWYQIGGGSWDFATGIFDIDFGLPRPTLTESPHIWVCNFGRGILRNRR